MLKGQIFVDPAVVALEFVMTLIKTERIEVLCKSGLLQVMGSQGKEEEGIVTEGQ